MQNSSLAAIIAIVVIVIVAILFIISQKQPAQPTVSTTSQSTSTVATTVNTTVTTIATTTILPLSQLAAKLIAANTMLYGIPNQSAFYHVQNTSLQENGYRLYEDTYSLPYNSLVFSTKVLNSSTVMVVAPQYANLTYPLAVIGGVFEYDSAAAANSSYSTKVQSMMNNTFGFKNLTALNISIPSIGASAKLWGGYAYGQRVYLLVWRGGNSTFVFDTYGNLQMNDSYIRNIGGQWGKIIASTS